MSIETPSPLIPRRALPLAERKLQGARVLVVNGARQSGKTALLGLLQGQLGGTYVTLDRAADLRSARTDPTGFVTGFEEPLFIDEVQRGGDPLVLAVKYEADRTRRRGRFVLAGPTRFLTEPRLSESLAGRVRFVDMWPCSQGEIDGTNDSFLDAVLADSPNVGKLERQGSPDVRSSEGSVAVAFPKRCWPNRQLCAVTSLPTTPAR